MNEKEYLEFLLEKLHRAVEASDKKLWENSEEINKMHDYYWENYNEFDEFGYEDFSNRQMLETEVNLMEDEKVKNRRYKKMLNSPYFGRIDFIYDDEDEVESYYIGLGNFQEKNGQLPLVYDWRAPVSSLFYDYDKGRASYKAPGGLMEGEISKKCQYKIRNGELLYSLESDIKIDDDILKKELSLNGDARLKSIVSTIQKEQNQIIRNESDKVLIVQGSAGSGKTSVALHRIAYLLYHHRNDMKAANVLIFSPNGVFADYISHILPELGEENILEMNFDDFAHKELKKHAGLLIEDRYDNLEKILRSSSEDGRIIEERTLYKQSLENVQEINGFVLDLEYELMHFRKFKFKKIEKTADELAVLFYEKFPDIPILSRMETIASYISDEAATLAGKDMDEAEEAIILEKLNRMYKTSDLLALYNRFLARSNEKGIDMNSRIITYEDVFPLLYMKYKLFGTGSRRNMKHIVIDEMQDYSYMQYLIIKMLFKDCPVTILGDREQSMAGHENNVINYLKKIFGRESKIIEMKKSYRQTMEIASFAGKIIDSDNEYFERHGDKVFIEEFNNENDMFEAMVNNIKSEAGLDTIAILCMNEDEVSHVYENLKDKIEITKFDKDTEVFTTGVIVSAFYLAKGLEFDAVHIYDASDKKYTTSLHRQILYIDSTRALHRLSVYSNGKISRIIES